VFRNLNDLTDPATLTLPSPRHHHHHANIAAAVVTAAATTGTAALAAVAESLV